ncbi:MAG: hypothetical protein Q8O64_03270 [Sideroxyarcus sp.]|nr:hypothetical protein [Sideroxyarcus sp.]
MTALAPQPVVVQPLAEATTADTPAHRAASHYLWTMLQAGNDPQWESSPQPEPVFEFDQRVAW